MLVFFRGAKYLLINIFLIILVGCSSTTIDKSYTAKGQDSRIQYVVVHYTVSDLPTSLKILTERDVSSHYLIGDETPKIYQLVDEKNRAWHAGQSQWKGRSWLNSTTIGIELVNSGYRDTSQGRKWQPFNDKQISALIVLLKDIVKRYNLPINSVIGHSDIAPQRKLDPGPLFPWKRLADEGLISWPSASKVQQQKKIFAQRLPGIPWFQRQLAIQGYGIQQTGVLDRQTRNVIAAFQMKYRQSLFDGKPDAETAAILLVLNQQ